MDQITGDSARVKASDPLVSDAGNGRNHVVVIYNPKAGQRRYPLFSSVIERLKAQGVAVTILRPGRGEMRKPLPGRPGSTV